MAEFNAVNRGVYIADNLDFLRALNDRCVDLVCIDPPFAKNDTFTADRLRPPLSEPELETEFALLRRWGINSEEEARECGIVWPESAELKGGYKDIWSWEKDVHEVWVKEIEQYHPGIHVVIEATRLVQGDSTAAYLCYMAVRLLEIHRVLKDTGSFYLHCDHTAGAYLRQLLDGVFGKDNFRNEIVWRRTNAHNKTSKQYGPIHDTILFYSKGNRFHFNPGTVPLMREYVKEWFTGKDERGSYRTNMLTGSGTRTGSSGQPWHGFDPTSVGRHWAIPASIRSLIPPEGKDWNTQQMLDFLYDIGVIYIPRNGAGQPKYKQYVGGGIPYQDIWAYQPYTKGTLYESEESLDEDVKWLEHGQEKLGYPTQKPIALAERIIESSSNPGDVVLDCFAGCAYVGVAAERLGRQWIACDINPRAWTVFKRQFAKPSLHLLDCSEETAGQQVMGGVSPAATVHGPNELPARTTPEEEGAPNLPRHKAAPERKYKVPASLIPEPEMLRILLEMSDYKAWCCGYANRMPDGRIVRTTRNFHLDHIDPKSKEGSNDIQNRAPLCPYHNVSKNNRRIHLDDYRKEIADAGEMLVHSTGELIHLPEALQKAMQIYAEAWARRNGVGV